jgi:hypothetical protein
MGVRGRLLGDKSNRIEGLVSITRSAVDAIVLIQLLIQSPAPILSHLL